MNYLCMEVLYHRLVIGLCLVLNIFVDVVQDVHRYCGRSSFIAYINHFLHHMSFIILGYSWCLFSHLLAY